MGILTETTTLEGTIVAKSAKALLWRPRYTQRQVWLPLSCVVKEQRNFAGSFDKIVITVWLAKKMGLS